MTKTVEDIKTEMLSAAAETAKAYFQNRLGGKDNYPCGFAWITVYPKHKGNTKNGRAERQILAALGFAKDYTGKSYQLWNPSGLMVQNMDCKVEGAAAGANVLKKYGFNAYCGSRMD